MFVAAQLKITKYQYMHTYAQGDTAKKGIRVVRLLLARKIHSRKQPVVPK